MRNPFKKLKDRFGKKKPAHTSGSEQIISDNQRRVEELWPDGTWNMVVNSQLSAAQWDGIAREVIGESWEYEVVQEFRARNPDRGLWRTFPDPMPQGWTPSQAAMMGCAQTLSWDIGYVKYMLARLKTLGHLRA